jgi:hypothetical protein
MLPYFPLDRDDYAMTMNARALPIDCLIEVEPGHYAAELAEKEAILASDYHYYFRSPAEAEAHAWDAIELLLPNMARHHPRHFTLEITGDRWHWHNRLLGTTIAFTLGAAGTLPLPPLDWLGHQVQEDLLIMAEDPAAGTPLIAGHLCFASGWCLDDKLGQSFLAIHEPVPIFAERIGRSADLLMQRLKPHHPTGRVGWSLTTSPALNRAPKVLPWLRDDERPIDAEAAGERCYLRLERQTFSRLPRTRGVLFTIHTYLAPLGAVLAEEHPARARRLATVLRTMPAPLLRYKGIDRFQAPLLDYLDRLVAEDTALSGRSSESVRSGGDRR